MTVALSSLSSTGGLCLHTLTKGLGGVIQRTERVVHEGAGQKGERDVVGANRGVTIVYT